ncbi:MAG: hypothetical protein ACOH2H_00210 [Cypionkella sp.]
MNRGAMAPVNVEILLRPGFVGLEVAAIIDTLRIANRVLVAKVCTCHQSSDVGGQVEGAGGVCLRAAVYVSFDANPRTLIVPGNDAGRFLGNTAINRILRLRRTGPRDPARRSRGRNHRRAAQHAQPGNDPLGKQFGPLEAIHRGR